MNCLNDNEYGYAFRMADLTALIAGEGFTAQNADGPAR
jgi:hypothetical protein